MRTSFLLPVYCILIVAASVAGGRLPQIVRLTHTRMQVLVSLVAGLMLGVALFHLFPHAALEIGSVDRTAVWTMFGLLTMFFLIRAFHFHQHAPAEHHEPEHPPHEHDHDFAVPAHRVSAGPARPAGPSLNWVGLALGLGAHTLLDGAALAASVEAESHAGSAAVAAGMGTFLAIALHKPLDAMSIVSVMAAGGWTARWQRAVNMGYAVLCPLGAAAFWIGARQAGPTQQLLVGCALAFSAGVFLCISLADLLPEVQFHTHDRVKLSAALLIGIALAWVIRWLEPGHLH